MTDRTPKVFLRNPSFVKGKIALGDDQKQRLTRVLRLNSGDSVEILSPGKRWQCRISDVQKDGLLLDVESELEATATPRCELILAQAIPKGDRFDWLIQKCTELGVAEIFPLVTERTVVKVNNPAHRVERWNRISDQAAAQSEGAYPTLVHSPVSLPDFLKIPRDGMRILLHEREGYFSLRSLLDNVQDRRITFVVGPEGGWAPEETAELTRAGYTRVQLGRRVLRSETAGLALAAILQYCCGEFSE